MDEQSQVGTAQASGDEPIPDADAATKANPTRADDSAPADASAGAEGSAAEGEPAPESTSPPDGEATPDDTRVSDDDSDRESVSELVEQVGHDTGILVLRQVQLTASRHIPALRRTARDVATAAAALVAGIAAFALANWAAVVGLSSVLPGWQAPLVLAAAWTVLALVLLLVVLRRTGHLLDLRWWRAATADPAQAVASREQAREEAQGAVRESLERLGGAIAAEAQAKIRAALMPMADSVLDAGDGLLETADEITDVIEDKIPGGGVINSAFDLVLVPGRFWMRTTRTVLGRRSRKTQP